MGVERRRRLIVLGLVAAALVGGVSAWVVGHRGTHGRSGHRRAQAATTPPPTSSSPSPSAPRGNWPSARDTGADPATATHHLATSGAWYRSSAANLTIANAELDGGVYWTGSGTLTLRNVILRPDWAKVFATVYSVNNGSVVIDHVTITGTNIGAGSNFTKGFTMGGSGSLDVGYLNESGICQNNLGSGPANIHDSYIHDIGSGNGATCHTTGIELESRGSGPITIRHNTIDEFPGKDFVAGTDGAVFEQGLYGPIPEVVIDHNYLHGAYWSIEISPGGRYAVTGPVVTNNCLAWPNGGSGGAAVSDPRHTIKVWTGNTRCDDSGHDTGRPVPLP